MAEDKRAARDMVCSRIPAGKVVFALCSGFLDAMNGQVITVDNGLPFRDNSMMAVSGYARVGWPCRRIAQDTTPKGATVTKQEGNPGHQRTTSLTTSMTSKRATIDTSKSMKDYGANSLDIIEVVSSSMRELAIKIPRSELADISTIDQLADRFMQYVNKRRSRARQRT